MCVCMYVCVYGCMQQYRVIRSSTHKYDHTLTQSRHEDDDDDVEDTTIHARGGGDIGMVKCVPGICCGDNKKSSANMNMCVPGDVVSL